MITIILLVSRLDFLEKVISSIELLDCDAPTTNLLAIVDGDEELYVRTRNLVNLTKYNQRLVVPSDYPGPRSNLDIPTRRARIAANHNQARALLAHDNGYVLSVEDDTGFSPDTLRRLLRVADNERAFGFVEGVQLGRWGVKYVGGWVVDDIYDPKSITSVPIMNPRELEKPYTQIDAGGMYCSLIRADLYKQHDFVGDNGLGPDVNFGIEARQLGFQNFIAWDVPCTHFNKSFGKEEAIEPTGEVQIVTLTRQKDKTWHVSY